MASFAPSVTARMEMAMVRELTSSFHALAILPKESMSFAPPTGTLPTNEDIWKVISDGLHGTAMVPWITLSETDRWALVAYVESFSPRFAHEARPTAVKMTMPPLDSSRLIAKGQKLFGDAGCVDCHGARGLGDGPSSPSLVDVVGRPIRPLDFRSGVFRRGSGTYDIFLTVRTGLDGTPMPLMQTR